jgi:hypothetical protein
MMATCSAPWDAWVLADAAAAASLTFWVSLSSLTVAKTL